MNLEIFQNGGTMPVTGETFDGPGYPNARLISCDASQCINTDGGLPQGVRMAAMFAQIADSGNLSRAVTAVTELEIGSEIWLPADESEF